VASIPPRRPRLYAMNRSSVAPSTPSWTPKPNPVVVIGVDRCSVGGDDGIRPCDERANVERGQLAPRSMLAGREPGGKMADLSE
jgi:hypothetical protein